MQLHTTSQEQLKDLLVNTSSSISEEKDEQDLNTKKVIAFYNAAMDEETIEKMGIEPLGDLLALCDMAAAEKEASNDEGVASCLGKLLCNYGISSFFSIGTCIFLFLFFIFHLVFTNTNLIVSLYGIFPCQCVVSIFCSIFILLFFRCES